ncbi:uncharacterized protein HMPREF1541_00084 [Cyphellophora europaea CBS 101466]|uniref:AB hydrolase-1 domain-containing protein n=1 Tax=Cyphellophora europaea (strain CBS 101466) TaxID=1220924 RepID=W2SD25_CYPE1|nr:uncharacterized protein HMPREF1541_00084 [Cyphellophora europaea CBS 101466]ETN45903.1 hypothetical protein HMPREF1541_00084 [Cyphellophora europaea CBS 101466]
MPYLSSPIDGARLVYSDYGPPPPSDSSSANAELKPFQPSNTLTTTPLPTLAESFTLVFLHGWPMSSRMFTHLMLPLSQNHGIRCVAPDRRGFGKSEWGGISGEDKDTRQEMTTTYDTFAADTRAVLQHAGIDGNWAFAAASMGCGEALLACEGLEEGLKERFKGFIWMGPSLPFPLQCESNPTAPPRELWDTILQGLRDDRVGFVREAIHGVFGTRADMGLGIVSRLPPYFEDIVKQADALAVERCTMIITGRDLSEELKKVDRRVLVLHGDGDQGMPASASAHLIEKLVPVDLCEVKIYEKAAHGLYLTHAGQVMEDILRFVSTASPS